MTCDKGNKPHGGKYTKLVNCPARINATLKDNGLWVVRRVVTNHIHQLDPFMSRFMARHRCLTDGVKRSLEANDIAGIRPFKSIRLLEVQSDGLEKMGCLPKDCRNFIYNRRRLRLDEGGAESIQKLFSRLRNILWVHPRGKAAYEEFHDVIYFDTTYLVNTGCLLQHSLQWETLIPMQFSLINVKALWAAIREVMPETRYRFCLWHILSKLSKKFKGVEDFTKATNEFKALIFDTLTIEMFKRNWNEFLTKYGLENNEWLTKLYFERESWFQHAFTHEMFKLVQEQIKCLWYCDVKILNEDEGSNKHGMERYNILERCIINYWYHKEFVYNVEHRENGQYFSCKCRRFDSSGILCCHILKVIITKGIEVINERYLPRRWRKDVHRPYNKKFFAGGYPMMTEEYKKYRELEGDFEQINDIIIGNTQKMEYVKRQLRVLKVNLSEWNDGLLASEVGLENVGVANSDSSVAILNPHEARSHGRP
ncbi:protein FAR1-RELATED SEQUENCE 5-like [Hevea brasiliensis]|uniref:protein FAR1-RELATED SEQUENCE 5-like n=1 Tax=Hevea brasiliensis TaxID=3981 RepID=UPI0025E6FB6D|nr:protein FAR1-RELATED SEQUENCE 5-like [Hevea brasiliensis]